MAGKPCFACGAAMSSPDGKSGQCANPGCPGGRRFYYCGYCREISFSLLPDRMKCFNKGCRTFNIPRSKCPTCDKISIIPFGNRTVCVNRDCTDNASVVSMCFFCSNKAFLNAPDLMFCTKGNCEHLFKRVEACSVCRANSFVVDESVCKNASCEIAGVLVESCPKCRQRTLAEDAGGSKRCLNKSCNYKGNGQVVEEQAPPDFEGTLVMPAQPKKNLPQVEDPSGALAVPAEFRATPMEPEPYGRTLVSTPPPPQNPDKPFRAPFTGKEPPKQPSTIPPAQDPTPKPVFGQQPGPAKPPAFGQQGKPPVFGQPKVEPPPQQPPPTPQNQPPPIFGRQPPPDPTPRPAANNPPPVAPTPQQRLGTSAIEDTYQFLRSTLMETEDGGTCPLYLIIGLSGSGKSTYLTFLGDILGARQQRFSWPYEGIDIKWIKVEDLLQKYRGSADPKKIQQIRVRVKDLVYDFSQDMHQKYTSKQHWPPATARDEGDETHPATYFLVTEITRHMKSVAKVITLETSGEEYEEVLRNFKSYTMGVEPKNAIQRVLLELMNDAEGFIVLLDPDNIDTDSIFRNFFMVLKEELQPRALNNFYRELGATVGSAKEGQINPNKISNMNDLLVDLAEQERRRRDFEESLENAKRIARDRLAEIFKKLEAGRDDILQAEDGKWLNTLQDTLEKQSPSMIKAAKEKVLPAGARFTGTELKERLLMYYKGLSKVCAERIDQILREQLEKTRPPQTRSSTWEIKKKYGLSDAFKIEIDARAFAERPVRRFKSLKYVNVTITKSDKYPIIWPPEMYPKRKLASSELFLRDLQDYLKLCGGCVRYYNASATGYTLLSGGAHIPGPVNTHTPINILEPLFDMLNITA